MRIQLLSLILLSSLLVSFPAIAADWVYVGSGSLHGSPIVMYVDKQGLEGDITGRKFWEEVIFENEQILHTSGKHYISIMSYVEIDCKNSTRKIYETNFYSNDGGLVKNWLNPDPNAKSRIAPDSLADFEKKYVCSFKQTK